MVKGLLIVDLQNDYFPGGAAELPGMAEVADNCRLLVEKFRSAALPVFHVQHYAVHYGAAFFLPGSKGAAIHDSVLPVPGEAVIVKSSPNAFVGTWLLAGLHRAAVHDLVVCGATTQMCIDSTVRAAFDFGFACTLASDACAARAVEFDGATIAADTVQAAFLAALNGTFARIGKTQELINET